MAETTTPLSTAVNSQGLNQLIYGIQLSEQRQQQSEGRLFHNEDEVEKHRLTVNSHPAEFVEAFLPTKTNAYKNKSNQPYLSLSEIQRWTNLKAELSDAGTDDGFQCDALCDRGFTISIYFRNEKPPKKFTKQGLSPLHARVMWLFDKIEIKFTRVWMDNLYISAKFAKAAWIHEMKIMIAGVSRRNGRGVALSVTQEEQKDRKEMLKVKSTVKAAVLVGDKDVPNLLCVSVYDTKPVHSISMICDC